MTLGRHDSLDIRLDSTQGDTNCKTKHNRLWGNGDIVEKQIIKKKEHFVK